MTENTPRQKTFEEINENMLKNLPAKYPRAVGFMSTDLLRTNALELEDLYKFIALVIEKMYVENLQGTELETYVYDRTGLTKNRATFAKVILTITGSATLKAGDLFSTANNIDFKVLEDVVISDQEQVKCECTIAGEKGLVGAGAITEMPITIPGIVSVINEVASYDGFEEESDDAFRTRYFEAMRAPATSGNIYHYIKWAKEIAGVGRVKVFPQWNGNLTVQTLIIDQNMLPTSIDLLNEVQEYIDPFGEDNSMWGQGYGQAPVGSYCTVTSATALNLEISVEVVLSSGTKEEATEKIRTSIMKYLESVALVEDFVSFAVLGSHIISAAGVKHYTNLTINGLNTDKIDVGPKQVPVLYSLVVN